jgi:hypothetical protein
MPHMLLVLVLLCQFRVRNIWRGEWAMTEVHQCMWVTTEGGFEVAWLADCDSRSELTGVCISHHTVCAVWQWCQPLVMVKGAKHNRGACYRRNMFVCSCVCRCVYRGPGCEVGGRGDL